MASRPLPPGRRGRGPRVASGLHQLPEVKLLDVPEASSGSHPAPVHTAPVVNAPAEPQAPASTESEKTTSILSAAEPQHAGIKPQSNAYKASVSVASVHAAASVVAVPVKPVVVAQPVVKTPPPPAYQSQTRHVPPAVVALPVQNTPIRSPSTKAPAATPAPVSKPISPSPAAAALAVTTPASTPAPRAPVPHREGVQAADLGEFHPFYLLLPVDAVPPVPESVECIYDEAAVEMQKNVLKVIKKLLGRDKMKLEDFKINSRLFGNNFMEPYEYLESLVKDLGGVRALQLVPCLLVIQPDFMKRSGLLIAARNYRLRHLAALEAQCQALRAVEAAPAPKSISPPSQPLPTAAPPVAVEVAEAIIEEPAKQNDDSHEGEKVVVETVVSVSLPKEVAPEQKAELAVFAALVGSEAVATMTAVVHSPDETNDGDVISGSGATEDSSSVTSTPPIPVVKEADVAEVHESLAFQTGVAHSSKASVALKPHVTIESDTVQPVDKPELSQKSVKSPTGVVQIPSEPKALEPSETNPAEAGEVVARSVVSSHADAVFDSGVDMLPEAFRQAFASYEREPVVAAKPASAHVEEPTSSSKTHKVDVEPTSMSSTLSNSSSSFHEAENLFGERLSTGSTSSENADNLFGESMSQPAATPTVSASMPTAAAAAVAAAAPAVPAPKRVHSQLLFGFATAGADTDSDSDDSGFSSS